MEQENNTTQEAPPNKEQPTNKPIGKPTGGLNKKAAMLHTYKQDVESLVRKRKISLVKALAMQSDKMPNGEDMMRVGANEVEKQNKKTSFILLASITMIILGMVAIGVAYTAYQTKKESLTQDKARVLISDSLLFVEHRTRLDVTDRLPRETLAELSRILVHSRATLGSITQVLLEDEVWDSTTNSNASYTISQKQLISLLGLSLGEQFTRLLGNADDYMLGMHMANRNSPFLLLTTQSYDHAFASMLNWEGKAEMELSPLFTIPSDASSKRTIEDIVIQNIDARVIRDENKDIRLLYAFLDQNSILITNNIHTLIEVASRRNIRKASGSAEGL